MAPPQIVTSFNENSQLDFFKCILLLKKIKLERLKYPEDPSKAHTNNKLFQLKRTLDLSPFQDHLNSLDLETAEKFATENFLKIRIWKQVERRKPVFLEYEAKISDDPADFSDLDLFSKTFDTFRNQDFSHMSLILDIDKFLKNKKYSPAENKPMFRQMTLFQAIATELWPNLNGPTFNKKVEEMEKSWESDSFHLEDAKKLHDLFGVGIQIWTMVKKSGNHYEPRKIWDTHFNKKVRIRVKNFDLEERFPLTTSLEYIYDEVAIHYYSCKNKGCFYGTARRDHFETHVRNCRTEPVTKYVQDRFYKPENNIQKELFEERILPNENFENVMFCTYDIGKFIFGNNYFFELNKILK